MRASTDYILEYFEAEDVRFLPAVLGCRVDHWLARLAERWYGDGRGFARRELLRYIDDGCTRPGHRALVKRLFKLAEAAEDDEVMIRFMVAFDRFPRRSQVTRHVWRYDLREYVERTHLLPDPEIPRTREEAEEAGVFTARTRMYLCRRAFRYMRYMGWRDAERYRRCALEALPLYRDAELGEGLEVLDAWSLIHVTYYDAGLWRRWQGIGTGWGEVELEGLEPAPFLPGCWEGRVEELLGVLREARSGFVRRWVVALLERDEAEALASLPLLEVHGLVCGRDPETQSFGVRLLKERGDLGGLGPQDWVACFEVEEVEALAEVCALSRRWLDPERLTLEQQVELACVRAAPVAEMALGWLLGRGGDLPLDALVGLAHAEVERVRVQAMAELVAPGLEAPEARFEHVRELLDSAHEDVREVGLGQLTRARWRTNTALWVAMSESPWGHVRDALVALLDAEGERGLDAEALRRVWATALLSPHRGGRAKRAALRQLRARLVSHPDEAWALIPLMGVALRSVRERERRAALAALTRAVVGEPTLRPVVEEHIRELELGQGVTS